MTSKLWALTTGGRSLFLVYAGGWLAFTFAVLSLYAPPTWAFAAPGALVVEIIGAAVCGTGLLGALRSVRAAGAVDEAPMDDWHALTEAQARMSSYMRDAQAHLVVVPLLLISLCLPVVLSLSDVPHATPTLTQWISFTGGFGAIAIGSLRPTVNVWRESRRLARLDAMLDMDGS